MWKEKLATFIGQFDHPGWGITHSERVYALALKLAEQQGIDVDQDALLAAAYLHDVGSLKPYGQTGLDHAEKSADFAEEMLVSVRFPSKKIPLVKGIIMSHIFHTNSPTSNEAIFFRDADILDFLGAIGIARMLAMVGRDDMTPDVRTAVSVIQRFNEELPPKLLTPAGKKIGNVRQARVRTFLMALSDETDKLEAL